jgi:hypothetical protein
MNLENRCPLTAGELREYADEHLAYEIDMFRFAGQRVFRLGEPTTRDEWLTKMTSLEALVTHGRVLVDFLYPTTLRTEDIIANDFVTGLNSWSRIAPPISARLSGFLRRANGEVGHLTTRRIAGRPARKSYEGATFDDIDILLRLFARHADADRLSASLRDGIGRGVSPVVLIAPAASSSSSSSLTYAGGTASFMPPR